MKKYTILAISILTAVFGVVFVVQNALALDAPHNTNDQSFSITCSRCHYSATQTPTWATLPTTTDNTFFNNLCTDCHATGKLTGSKYEDIKTHSAQETGSAAWGGNWTVECRVCHSPHYQQQANATSYQSDSTINVLTGTVTGLSSTPGAATSTLTDTSKNFIVNQYAGYLLIPNTAYPTRLYRILSNTNNTITVTGAINLNYTSVGKTYAIRYGKMVNMTINYPGAPGVNPGQYAPVVKFFNETGPNSFGTSTNPSNITAVCQVCHTQTTSFNKTGVQEGPGHPGGVAGNQACTTCHTHSTGFKAGGCTGCHGNPPESAATLVYGSANGNDPAKQTGQWTAGAHVAHVNSQNVSCNKCHYNGMPTSPIDTSKTLQMGFDAVGGGTYYTRPALSNGYTYSIGPLTTAVSATTDSMRMACSNIYCHSNVQANGGNAGPSSYATVTWQQAGVQCGSCHNADGVQGNKTLMSTGSHTKHLSTANGFPAGTCNDCHSGNTHGNMLIEVNNSYSQGPASAPGSGGYGTCSAATCHDDGVNYLVQTPTWGTNAPKCSVCHAVVPDTGSHLVHLQTVNNIVCADCHKGTVQGTTANFTEHLDGNIDVYKTNPGDLGFPINRTKCEDYTSCSTAYCHEDGRGNVVPSPVWGTPNTDCSACHATKPSTGSHLAHLVSTQYNPVVCGDCHSGAVEATIATTGTQHRDNNIDVYRTTPGDLGYPANKTKATAFTKCTNIYCHSSGQSLDGTSTVAYSYASPTWGLASSGACGTCHPTSLISSGSHTAHLSSWVGATCGSCHSGASTSAYNSTLHVNYAIDVNIGSYNMGTTPGNGYGRCSAAVCHDNGLGVSVPTPTWGNHVADCSQCHAVQPATGSHLMHLVTTQATKAVCADCHYDAVQGVSAPSGGVHLDGNIDVYDTTPGDLGYPANKTKNTAYTQCSNVYCHSSGQGSTSMAVTPYSYGSPTWGNAASGACGTCHPITVAAGLTSGSHTVHLNTAANGAKAVCSDCHSPATTSSYSSTNHINRQINVTVSYTAGTTPGNGYGTCNATQCHGTNSGTWGANTSTAQCTKCHGQAGTTVGGYYLNTAAPGFTSTGTNTGVDTAGLSAPTGTKVGAHNAHLNTNNYALPLPCTSCHKVPTNVTDAGHIDSTLPAEVTGAYSSLTNSHGASLAYNYGTATCTNLYCHDGAYFKNGGVWSNGTDTSPTWNNTAYLNSTPTTSADCNKCHGYPPAGAHPADSNCVTCHSHVASTNLGFKPQGTPGIELHVNGALEGGGDACTDCHSTLLSSGDHAGHTDTAYLAGRSLTLNSYGSGSWWYFYSNTGGTPSASCGYCHPSTVSTHRNGVKNIDILNTDATNTYINTSLKIKNSPTSSYTQNPGVSVVCGSVYCHSNGYAPAYAYRNTPEWYGGSFTGDKCAGCHGNSPTGSAIHSNHAVGMHYDDIFTGTVGTMVAGTTGTNAHGNSAYSTTINCNVCHSLTVASGSFNNDLNTLCNTCHNGTQASLQGTMVVAATSTRHVDGTPDVAFANVTMKSKAQLRDDITTVPELNSTWTRTGGYKANGSYDMAKSSLSASATWNSAAKTCSTVACHNGITTASWTNPGVSTCTSCHTALPQ